MVDDEDADAAAVTCAPLAHFRSSMRERDFVLHCNQLHSMNQKECLSLPTQTALLRKRKEAKFTLEKNNCTPVDGGRWRTILRRLLLLLLLILSILAIGY